MFVTEPSVWGRYVSDEMQSDCLFSLRSCLQRRNRICLAGIVAGIIKVDRHALRTIVEVSTTHAPDPSTINVTSWHVLPDGDTDDTGVEPRFPVPNLADGLGRERQVWRIRYVDQGSVEVGLGSRVGRVEQGLYHEGKYKIGHLTKS